MKRYLTTLLTVAMLAWVGYASAQAKKPAYLTNAQLKALLSETITVRVSNAADPTAIRVAAPRY